MAVGKRKEVLKGGPVFLVARKKLGLLSLLVLLTKLIPIA